MKTRNNIQQIAQRMDASSLNICSRIDLTVNPYDEVCTTKDYCSILIDFYVQQEHVSRLRYRRLKVVYIHICKKCLYRWEEEYVSLQSLEEYDEISMEASIST
jgi:hypothetical protein